MKFSDLQSFTTRLGGLRSNLSRFWVKKGRLPVARDWTILLASFFVLLVGVFAFGGWFFYTTFVAEPAQEELAVNRSHSITVDTERLEGALEQLENKETRLGELRGNPPEVSDPSLPSS